MLRRIIYMVVVTMFTTAFFLPHAVQAKRSRSAARDELSKFEEFISIMDKSYIDSLDYHYLMEVAINAILDETDPYSTYFKSQDKGELSEMIESTPVDTAYLINSTTTCIKVKLFSKNTAHDILSTHRALGNKPNLVLDLRGNKGGLVSEAIGTSNLFLVEGVELFKRSRRGRSMMTYKTQHTGALLSTNVIVVIDSESASASEIVASSLQINNRAFIVGERSYGKGLIITPFTLSDGSMVVIATSQYTTPKGGVIQRSYRGRESSSINGGVTPDVEYECHDVIEDDDYIMFIMEGSRR